MRIIEFVVQGPGSVATGGFACGEVDSKFHPHRMYARCEILQGAIGELRAWMKAPFLPPEGSILVKPPVIGVDVDVPTISQPRRHKSIRNLKQQGCGHFRRFSQPVSLN